MLLRGSLDVRKSIHLADTQILQALSQFNTHEHKLKAMLIFTLKEPFFCCCCCWENERKPTGNFHNYVGKMK